MAYVLQLEQIERMTLADRQALIARGVGDDLPNVVTAQAKFDEWLVSEPKQLDDMTSEEVWKLEERIALGVA